MPLANGDSLFWDTLDAWAGELRAIQWGQPEPLTFPYSIEPDAIVIRKIRREREHERGFENEAEPGILISPGNQTYDPKAGTNERDDGIWEAVAQIIVPDPNLRENGLRTVMRWQEQIRRRTNQATRNGLWPHDTRGEVIISYVVSINTIDERYWVPHHKFVAGVYARWKSRETRDPQAHD